MNHAEPSPVVPGVRPIGVPGWVHARPRETQTFREFYSQLFSWEWRTVAGSVPGEQRFIAFSHRRPVASISSGPQEATGATNDIPTRWSVCFTSNDLRETTQKILTAGGSTVCQDSVAREPHQLLVAEARDSNGGLFTVLSEASIPPDSAPAGPAAVTWAELVTKDVHRSTEFYEEVFDLGDMGLDGVNAGYQTLTKDDQSWAGVVDVSQRFPNGLSTIQGNPAPQWVPWFGVTDLHESVAIVTKLGGRVVLDPLELMPGLALCVVQGLEGELFTLHEEDFGPGPDATAAAIEH